MGCEALKSKPADGVSCSNKIVSPHEIYRISSKYLFGLCPGGMGADTYRLYEFLFMGVIPVVEPFFSGEFNFEDVVPDLPLLQLDKPSGDYKQKEIVRLMRDYI